MKFTPVLIAATAVAAAASAAASASGAGKEEYPLLPTFDEYVELYGKEYGGCAKARAKAKATYLATVRRIVGFHKLKDTPFEIEINRFSDGEPPKGYNFGAALKSASPSQLGRRALHSLGDASIVVEKKKHHHHHKGYKHREHKRSPSNKTMTIEESEEM